MLYFISKLQIKAYLSCIFHTFFESGIEPHLRVQIIRKILLIDLDNWGEEVSNEMSKSSQFQFDYERNIPGDPEKKYTFFWKLVYLKNTCIDIFLVRAVARAPQSGFFLSACLPVCLSQLASREVLRVALGIDTVWGPTGNAR